MVAVTAGPEGVIITPLLLISLESGYSDNTGKIKQKKCTDMEKKPTARTLMAILLRDLENTNSDMKSWIRGAGWFQFQAPVTGPFTFLLFVMGSDSALLLPVFVRFWLRFASSPDPCWI